MSGRMRFWGRREYPQKVFRRKVLIVDSSKESRDVLRTVLQRRGMEIWEASEARQGLQLAKSHQVELIVLDAEAHAADEEAVQKGYDAEVRRRDASLLILGGVHPRGLQPNDDVRGSPENGRTAEFVPKPYHYGPLVHTIERLLARSSSSVSET